MSRVRRPNAAWVRIHPHDLRANGLLVVKEIDRVPERSAHLGRSVRAGQGPATGHEGSRCRKDGREPFVEASGDFASELDVGRLVRADRNDACLHEEDVRCLQDRISKKAVRGSRDPQLAELVLECWDSLRPRDGHEHREVEKELRGLRHMRLEVDRGLVRIDAHR